MIPRVTVLATLHVVQGAEKRLGNVRDPMYVTLLNKLILSEARVLLILCASDSMWT